MPCYDGFGNLADGRPIWIGKFSQSSLSEVLFYYPGDRNWWLGTHSGGQLQWRLVGNTIGFGQIWDGRPFWIEDFNGDGMTDVLFYYPGNHNWHLGRWNGSQLNWATPHPGNPIGNTSGFGNLTDGRPIWIGKFSRTDRSQILFYYPGDKNWWLGTYDGNWLQWNLVGNTIGFGQIWDGRPFWIEDFNGDGMTDVLFYYPGDRNWWLGTHSGGQLQWRLVGNTIGFGQIWDGRPFWIGDFNGDGRKDVLFYYPGDKNWWLGRFDLAGNLTWNFAGNTIGFGNTSRNPHYVGRISRSDKEEIMFYYNGDGNWWLGSLGTTNQLSWRFVSNTGRPFKATVTLHVKVLENPRNFTIDAMLEAMRQVYATANIRVDRGTTENLNLPLLNDLDIGRCVRGETTDEQNQLFNNRNNVGNNHIAVYFIRSTNPPTNGCAAHPNGRPSCVITSGASRWTLAHEVGHVLGLNHVDTDASCLLDRLMTGCGTGRITNPPPDLITSEINTMDGSNLSVDC
jgi:hypothetical protein